jgi:cytochrome P450
MITLLVAGHETTTAQLSTALQHLLEQPEKWQALCDDPALIANGLEEMMRFDPSVCTWRRLARQACTIGGVEIPKDSNLLLMLNSGNRDTAVFPEPDEIILDRKNASKNLAFGFGIHYCVGAPLARLEMRLTFEELTRRIPTMQLVPDQTYRYVPNLSFRGPLALQVVWE